MKQFGVILLALSMVGCAKQPAQAPVPGSINVLDAWAFRSVSDASASIHSVKIWEQCSDPSSPKTVNVDGTTENCDPTASPFPMKYKSDLNSAIQALNVASAAGKAYHSGASNDTQGLTAAIAQLTAAITQLMSHIGGSK
jgi:PBP1b-binding outer membrane lipoprotein LpoB